MEKLIKLPLYLKQVGRDGAHRSGWPYAMSYLKKINFFSGENYKDLKNCSGLLVDDFVERTFQYAERYNYSPWVEPWVGFFHHPRNVPRWFAEEGVLDVIFSKPGFIISRKNLIAAVTLSKELENYIGEKLQIPVITLKHPTEIPERLFSWEKFLENKNKKIIQIGWYLRNLRAIYQVKMPADFEKIFLFQGKQWMQTALKNVDQNSPYKDRPHHGNVEIYEMIDNDSYDQLLYENIVFLELFDTSVNNAVIECMVRNTPLVVNRLPALEEYLGKDYPLFFENFDDIHAMLTFERIKEAHEYLKKIDKSQFSGERFLSDFHSFIKGFAK